MPYGTLGVLDTLAASQQTVAAYGEDRAFEQVNRQRIIHNQLVMDALADFADVTSDNQRRYGGGDDGASGDELDEFGRPDASKIAAGVTVGFPLRKYGESLQWTADYFEVTTAAEFAAEVDAQFLKDLRAVYRAIRRAIFTPTNSTFNDRFVANVALALKAFVNADSADMPLGPNGETFNGATHTHFLATAALVAANLDSLIDTVAEHYGAGQVVVEINLAQETAVRAFTGFAPVTDVRVVQPSTAAYVRSESLETVNFNNRLIGIYRGAEIWVKSARIPASYLFAWMRGAPPPLVYRQRNANRGGLRLVADNESFPLRAQTRLRECGIGVWNRTNGAVLYTGGGTYVTPTI